MYFFKAFLDAKFFKAKMAMALGKLSSPRNVTVISFYFKNKKMQLLCAYSYNSVTKISFYFVLFLKQYHFCHFGKSPRWGYPSHLGSLARLFPPVGPGRVQLVQYFSLIFVTILSDSEYVNAFSSFERVWDQTEFGKIHYATRVNLNFLNLPFLANILLI